MEAANCLQTNNVSKGSKFDLIWMLNVNVTRSICWFPQSINATALPTKITFTRGKTSIKRLPSSWGLLIVLSQFNFNRFIYLFSLDTVIGKKNLNKKKSIKLKACDCCCGFLLWYLQSECNQIIKILWQRSTGSSSDKQN